MLSESQRSLYCVLKSFSLLYNETCSVVIYFKSYPKLMVIILHRVQSDMLRYEIRSSTWHIISAISVSLQEKDPNNSVELTCDTDGVLFHVFYVSFVCQVMGRTFFTPFMIHTLPMKPLGATAVISWCGDHTTGDGKTSNLPLLPMPEP